MDGRPAGWLAGRPAGRPNLKIMLTSAQLGLAGAWAELGKNIDSSFIYRPGDHFIVQNLGKNSGPKFKSGLKLGVP